MHSWKHAFNPLWLDAKSQVESTTQKQQLEMCVKVDRTVRDRLGFNVFAVQIKLNQIEMQFAENLNNFKIY